MADKSGVFDQLREAILRGDYAPKQRLIEAELAEEYHASRFVLRNALIALAAEGLVELQPNRGARIREISVEEAVEITEVRRAVEGLVAARAATRATDADAEFLRGLGREMEVAVDHGELMRYSELNAALHARLRDIAGHTVATRILSQMNGQMVRHQFRLALRPGRPGESLPEHLAIIDAVVRRDPDAAQAAMETHVGSVIRTLAALAPDGEVAAVAP